MILLFDTETTGFYQTELPLDHPEQGRLIEIAAILASPEGGIVETYSTMVQPGDCIMSEGAFKAHGITLEEANTEGIPLRDALRHFRGFCIAADDGAGTLVAHNLRFDMGVMLAEHTRTEMSSQLLGLLKPFCTMLALTPIMKLPGRFGQYKWPNLAEAARFLEVTSEKRAHRALADVETLHKVYYKGKEKGYFR